jgi:hypothetical protein
MRTLRIYAIVIGLGVLSIAFGGNSGATFGYVLVAGALGVGLIHAFIWLWFKALDW